MEAHIDNPGASRVCGAVDIGGTKILAGLVASDGRVIFSSECPTQPELGPEYGLRRIAAILAAGQADLNCRMEAIGIGCTGPVDPASGVIGEVDLLPGWKGFPLSRNLRENFAVPVCLENDCDAAALGEAGGQGQRFLYVSISTGIGAGLILDGEIYRGVGGAHPEVGHHSIDPSGPLCYCGANGCWESLASGTAVASWYRERSSSLGEVTAAGIFIRACEGEALASEAVERFTHYFAAGLGNLITLFAPDTIAVGGGVMASATAFFDRATHLARSRAGLVPANSIAIRPAALGRQAGLIGAANAARHLTQAPEGKL